MDAAQAALELDVRERVGKWMKDFAADLKQVYSGEGQMKPKRAEIK
jgi:hypothetical protein